MNYIQPFKKNTFLWNFYKTVAILIIFLYVPSLVQGASRIKDIADFEGVRDNLLIGYGIVVGLKGTGDDIDDTPFTKESLIAMLERFGVNSRGMDVSSDNIAAVMVTATLPPFTRQGTRLDVTISAIGNAESLLGGTLLVTPLIGANGEIYVLAQGQIQVGGFNASGDGATITKGVPTSGRIPNGAIVEKEINFKLNDLQKIKLSLRNPDFTTARRTAESINAFVGSLVAFPMDPGTIQIFIPESYDKNVFKLISHIEQLYVEPDQIARVIIDEQTGTIVIGKNVSVSKVAIAQGNLTIRISENEDVSQPASFSNLNAETIVSPDTTLDVTEGNSKLTVVEENITLEDLVNGLNSLGIGPRDLITILQAIKSAGALQAEIEAM